MEAAVRTVYEIVTGETLPRLELEEVRGLDGVKEAIIPLYSEGMTGDEDPINLRVAVCSGLGNAKKLINKMKNGEVDYDFVEVMACPGGCINGGGQPLSKPDITEKRLATVYALDRSLPVRKSHENPTVKAMYERLLGDPGGETAHRLLHVPPVYGGSGGENDHYSCEDT
jgi:NADH-quinone oxidoreductase subunit G